MFRDAGYWNLHQSAPGGSGPFNIPTAINDSSSSYANRSNSTMVFWTGSGSSGTCGSRAPLTWGNLFSPFQDSLSSPEHYLLEVPLQPVVTVSVISLVGWLIGFLVAAVGLAPRERWVS